MIRVTRMNGFDLIINAELIEFIESTPDTVLTLTTGKKFVLKDSVQDIIDRIIDYRKSIGTKIIFGNIPENYKNLDGYDE
ncbi:MAG: flagellar protein FlbD [Firmicutes bacterium HGW-Firmicutes-14]|nr:MAG: flagellar protein FlbD [Firmicutes bacterium HGW-Firmicutes-14]